MLRVVATTHEQTPPIPKPHLNPRVACRARRGHQFHFHKFRRLVALQLSRRGYFPQALLPGEEMWRTQPAFVTKCSHALPTPHLLRNQLPPLRPHFLASLLSIHPATLLHTHSPLQDALQVALTILLRFKGKASLLTLRVRSGQARQATAGGCRYRPLAACAGRHGGFGLCGRISPGGASILRLPRSYFREAAQESFPRPY